jgi:hypothetical protein
MRETASDVTATAPHPAVSKFRILRHELLVQLSGQRLDPLNQLLGKLRQLRVSLQEFKQLSRILCCDLLPLLVRDGKRFPVSGVRLGEHSVTRCLPHLGKQDERRSIGCLETESQVKQNKWIDVEGR